MEGRGGAPPPPPYRIDKFNLQVSPPPPPPFRVALIDFWGGGGGPPPPPFWPPTPPPPLFRLPCCRAVRPRDEHSNPQLPTALDRCVSHHVSFCLHRFGSPVLLGCAAAPALLLPDSKKACLSAAFLAFVTPISSGSMFLWLYGYWVSWCFGVGLLGLVSTVVLFGIEVGDFRVLGLWVVRDLGLWVVRDFGLGPRGFRATFSRTVTELPVNPLP